MTRPVKAGAVVVGMLGLLVLVAMAARGGHPGTSGRFATHPVPNTLQDSFITLLAITYMAVILAIVVGVLRYRDRWQDPHSRWLFNFALVVLLMSIATAGGYYAITHGHLRERAKKAQQSQGAGAGSGSRRIRHVPATPAREAHFQWPLALGVVGLVLLGGVWVYVRRRGEALTAEPRPTVEAALAETIQTTIDDLRREPDARRAVIAAYAQMERTLTEHGLARRRAEAPLEYLARVLRALHVRESAVRTLTELFEYAKFSRHEVGDAMKDTAIQALLEVRDDLTAEEAVAA